MRKLLLGTAVIAGLSLAGAAQAADMPLKAPAAPYYYNWSGFYFGGLVTFASTHSEHCDAGTCAKPGVVYPAFDMNDWLGGIEGGYNFQSGNVVFGVEADWSWGRVSGSSPSTIGFGCVGACKTSIDSIGTVRGRLGYAFDRLLPYVTAGVAFTDYHASIGVPILQESRTTRATFTGGGGLEYAFSGNWSLKAEYLFIRKASDFLYAPNECATPGCFARSSDIHTFRFGVNYKLGGPF
jgi:opacity protein-like surface antigen